MHFSHLFDLFLLQVTAMDEGKDRNTATMLAIRAAKSADGAKLPRASLEAYTAYMGARFPSRPRGAAQSLRALIADLMARS